MKKIAEAREVMHLIDEARLASIEDFPYDTAKELLNQNLKEILLERFGSSIKFDGEESLHFFHANYKGIPIEIITNNGIVLSIDNKSAECIIEDFKPVFDELFEAPAICEYDCFKGLHRSLNPTIEWNLHPEERIFELVHGFDGKIKGYISKFKDYYTTSIINKLGTNLLTEEGASQLFGNDLNNYLEFHRYKVGLILKNRSYLTNDQINKWLSVTSYNRQLIKVDN